MSELLTIPTTSIDSSYKIRTVLDEIELVLLFNWVERVERWHLSIYDASDVPLLMGLPLNVDTELLTRFEIEGLPFGKLFLYDQGGTSVECGRNDLGDRCQLIYQTV